MKVLHGNVDLHPHCLPASDQQEEALPSFPVEPSTLIQFTYQSNAQMTSILTKTAARCSDIATTYSIGRSVEGKDLLVIEFSNNPGRHELCKLLFSSLIDFFSDGTASPPV